jgi:circadian clock protein KaiB
MSEPHRLTSRRLLTQFERALRAASNGRVHLRLYVAGLTPKSTRAVADLNRLCKQHLAGRSCVEVIDIYQQPERAIEAQIVAVPTLVKTEPAPIVRMIGTLTESQKVLKNLGLAA